MLPAIFSLSGPELTPAEAAFFRAARPAGFILFNRNVTGRAQIVRLTSALRDLMGRGRLPILIDQEGGRVQMLSGPPAGLTDTLLDLIGRNVNPEFPSFPAPSDFGRLYATNPQAAVRAAHLNARLLAAELWSCGITVNCAPCLDVPSADAHPIIGDRALSGDPAVVTALARASLHGYRIQGVRPCIKHIPGHGRASADSHISALRITVSVADLVALDFAPFQELADAPFAMTTHAIYEAFDPDLPATLSPSTIRKAIRGHCGFKGVLLTDAIEMGALAGSLAERAMRAVQAGCDAALYCSGRLDHMEAIAEALPTASPETIRRFEEAELWGALFPAPADFAALRAERDRLLA